MHALKTNLEQYKNSRWSVADDDKLKNNLALAPDNTHLSIHARDMDGTYALVVQRKSPNWQIVDHWFYEKNAKVTDKMLAHDLTWLLRIANARVEVS